MKSKTNFPDYILLDAARLGERLDEVLESNTDHVNLYQGSSGLTLSRYAPYLFLYKDETAFSQKIIEEGWGDSWGVMVNAAQPINVLRTHFRKFLIVMNQDLKELYFRFYDPRVLRIFLPTCSSDQLNEFFGPVRQFICEDKDPLYVLLFSLEEGKLVTERVAAATIFPQLSKDEVAIQNASSVPPIDHHHKTPHFIHTHDTGKKAPRKHFD